MNYSSLLPIERDFDVMPSTLWFQKYWLLSVAWSALYILAIQQGKKFTSHFPTIVWNDLKVPLFIWNTLFSVFSFFGSMRMLPELISVLYNDGFMESVCNASYPHKPATGFWTEMFIWSKAVELGDTVFLLLRGRPVMFLHWYHHVTVMIYTWHACKDHTASGRWFISMNYTVHAVMYGYYAMRTLGLWKFPKWIPMSITTMQITQMFVGVAVALAALYAKLTGIPCQQTNANLFFCFWIYGTYFALFVKFFVKAYMYPRKEKIADAKKSD